MIWLSSKILLVLLILIVPNLLAKQALEIQTDGFGCDVFIPNLLREPIPNTDLSTGTFYVVRMKTTNKNSTLKSIGFITWSWKRNPKDYKYIYADWHSNLEDYTEGARWYQDSHWAFLKSRHPGRYHLINCAYPSFYATWSDIRPNTLHYMGHPFVVSPHYPGNHTKDDFLFKPVSVESEQDRVFQLVTKAFGEGIVSVSEATYSDDSTFLHVESKQDWEERVQRNGKEVEEKALFVFENTKDNVDYGEDYQYGCSCGNVILFTALIPLLILILVSACWLKKDVIIKYIHL